ncbi:MULTISPECIES: hypothetical protein [Streptococcus]|jgi:hypothetical protein|uniref:hypothetical protein n=1 Tax=Streptococcus TaxID=1301 RepID=UPI000660DCC8|nr:MULTISPECIES: hypothetical protein [Streptococcus]HEN3051845.1 hypothetical protein [Streptococcus agalactiae]MBF7050736.1 hypothetical protein [Streptococcus sp. HF-2466]UTX64641.1 hypothetical protein DEH83_04800 [Streptococcus constellatus]HEN3205732.1 hypothetical protein [Streptococcus agalactiae]HEN3207828.1 hypothetical protein [Streptococcus agalactiae]
MAEVTTIVYRLGSQYDEKMSAISVFDAHLFHAKCHGDKVLFTVPTQNNTKVGKKVEKIDNIILTLKDGSKSLFAEVDAHGVFPEKVKDGYIYTLPSQWDVFEEIEQGYTWFALKGVREISEEELNSYKSTNEREYPLLQSISGASCRIYVTEK